jgi:hypothetical protein
MFLIIFFILLIFYQLFLTHSLNDTTLFKENIIEGVENQYQDYDPKLIVQVDKNTSNIEFLKGQSDDMIKIKSALTNLDSTVQTLQTQVQNLTTAQQSYITPTLNSPDDTEDDSTSSLVPQDTTIEPSTSTTTQ